MLFQPVSCVLDKLYHCLALMLLCGQVELEREGCGGSEGRGKKGVEADLLCYHTCKACGSGSMRGPAELLLNTKAAYQGSCHGTL